MQTRKEFLRTTFSITTGTALLGFNPNNNSASENSFSSSVFFDLHSHTGRHYVSPSNLADNATAVKTILEMNASHLKGAFFALVADAKLLELGPTGITVNRKYEPGEAWNEYKTQLKNMKGFLQLDSVHISTKVKDLKNLNGVVAYLAVEGGDLLEGEIEKLDEVYNNGVRSIQLVHYAPNDLGDLQTAVSMHNGLSSFGKNVVRKMNQLGMLIDVAHASFQTAKDVADITDSPIMLSHSILEMEPDRPVAKRAISKDHAKVVAQTGGLIGAWPSGFNKNFNEYVDNIMRLIDAAGIDHVGIGTDMDGNFKPVLTSYNQYADLANALKTKGLSQHEVGKIMGGNAYSLLKKILKKK
jgi:membrane dipeptidase